MEKQEFNFVTGDGQTIISPNGKARLVIDYSRPVTLARCKDILRAAEMISGRKIKNLSMHHSIYSKSAGNECGDWAETCYLDKRYDYNAMTNSLVIYQDGTPVYANDNGVVCRDETALMDSQD